MEKISKYAAKESVEALFNPTERYRIDIFSHYSSNYLSSDKEEGS